MKKTYTFEYFKEMTDFWSREDLLYRLYELSKEIIDKEQKYNNIIDKISNKIKEDNEYLENAKEMYSEHDDELVKVATLQLINNNLVQNLELMMILEKAE